MVQVFSPTNLLGNLFSHPLQSAATFTPSGSPSASPREEQLPRPELLHHPAGRQVSTPDLFDGKAVVWVGSSLLLHLEHVLVGKMFYARAVVLLEEQEPTSSWFFFRQQSSSRSDSSCASRSDLQRVS